MPFDHLSRIVSIIWNNGGRFWSLIYYLASAGILHKYQVARLIEHLYPVRGRHIVYILFTMSPVWALLPVTILVGVAFYREILRLERRLRPHLGLSLQPREKCLAVIHHAPDGKPRRAKLLRLQVLNASSIPVKDCRAYLVDVQKRDQGARTAPLEYGDSLELSWSTREGEGPIDLPGRVPQYVNLLYAAEGENKLRLLRDQVPARYLDLFAEPGAYRLRIAVSGDGVSTETIDCEIDWPGQWDGLELGEPAALRPARLPLLRRATALSALAAGLMLAAGAAEAAVLARWVQYDSAGRAEARVVTDGPGCPALAVDGRPLPMAERAAPDEAFPVRVCAALLPGGVRTALLDGRPLPLPDAAPKRIVVIGDTGCRLKYVVLQACDDPAAWPFPRLAAKAAGLHPDLVIHVGDYYYRETPCLPGFACGDSPYGDKWPSWNADLFTPAAPLLAAAPWLLVRGNHEACGRGGLGWTRLLDPGRLASATPCVAHDPPYAVSAGGLGLVVLDVAAAPDERAEAGLVPLYRADFAALPRLAPGPSWLLLHRPLRGVVAVRGGRAVGGNATLIAASAGGLPASIGLLLSGHIHALEVLNYADGSPPQIVDGGGGDLLRTGLPERLDGLEVGGVRIAHGFALGGFGFLLLERGGDGGWGATFYDADATPLRRCEVLDRQVVCAGG